MRKIKDIIILIIKMLFSMLYYLSKLFWILFIQFVPQCFKQLYILYRANLTKVTLSKVGIYISSLDLYKIWMYKSINRLGNSYLKSSKYYFGY
jgi:hypothetical protein